MAFTVTDFKANLEQGGARPSLFSVELLFPSEIKNVPSKLSKFFVKGASIPASTVGAYDVYYNGKAIKVAGDRTFDTWETTIINDEDFSIRIALEQWMDLIADHRLNIRRKLNKGEGEGPEKYKQRLKLTQWTKSGREAWHYHFIGAFPTALSAIALDWGTASEIEEYTVTWTFDRWMPGTQGHLLISDSHQN